MYQIKPLGRRCLVKLDPVAEKKVGEEQRIFAPRIHSELTRTGKVLGLGEKVTVPVKLGDIILVQFHAGVVIDVMGEYFSVDDCDRIIHEDEILAVLA